MRKIVYKNLNNTAIGVIHPTLEGVAFVISMIIQQEPDIEDAETPALMLIAKKDTPSGLPFWLVDESVLPNNRENRDAWELDGSEGEPDGYGNETNLFE